MKKSFMWGVTTSQDVSYSGKKPEKQMLVDPQSIGSKPYAELYSQDAGGKVVRVMVYS